jgi:hypothetical protein
MSPIKYAQIDAVALRTESCAVDKESAAVPIKINGNADPKNPIVKRYRQWRKRWSVRFNSRDRTNRKIAAEMSRPSATMAGPNTGEAIRINIKEPPQIADSRTSRKTSAEVINIDHHQMAKRPSLK